ncbi:DUF4177 domain-containing protein [Geothermobacter hydrogeniphilus]|uniref:DUF4177 domain-containing protein n=2 Tax=Geothermobacter hydrogeniphilus TaxID=1969733 RepID=A0A2K2H944_9BACT|nr:DUF4177 domain-containing protein [Geothermobacter hydrogeniphilus]
MQPVNYKVIELTTVTDESLEEVLNQWSGEGWQLESIQFAMRESSRRPAMAFVIFIRKEG